MKTIRDLKRMLGTDTTSIIRKLRFENKTKKQKNRIKYAVIGGIICYLNKYLNGRQYFIRKYWNWQPIK